MCDESEGMQTEDGKIWILFLFSRGESSNKEKSTKLREIEFEITKKENFFSSSHVPSASQV